MLHMKSAQRSLHPAALLVVPALAVEVLLPLVALPARESTPLDRRMLPARAALAGVAQL